MGEQVTKVEAIERGLNRYFTGKPCKHGHVSARLTKCGSCYECHKASSRGWYQQLSTEERERVSKARRANYDPKYHQQLREYNFAQMNATDQIAYRAKQTHRVNISRCKKLGLLPEDADLEKIYGWYLDCQIKIASTGQAYEVDHIIPLKQGGLHVHTNLRVITRVQNGSRRKI